LALGTKYFEQQKFGQAEREFCKAVELEPENPANHYYLGMARYWQLEYDNAEMAFRQAVRLAPTDANNHYWLGRTFFEQGKHVPAEEAFREAARLEPTDANYHYRLGLACYEQWENTYIGEYVKLWKFGITKEFQSEWKAKAFSFDTGRAYLRDAEEAFREAVKLQPKEPKCHYWLGRVCFHQNKYAEAEESNSRGRELIILKMRTTTSG
jgi:cytochrome c-type biogenesis protein CcmH/NrfG